MKRLSLFLIALLPSITLAVDAPKQQGYPCTIESAAQTIAFAHGTLLVCYFGSAPEQKADGWIYVAGVSFHRIVKKVKNKQELIAESDELGLGIDYKFVNGNLEIIHYIDTYPAFKAVPFYKETVNLSKFPAQHEKQLIYQPVQVSKDEVKKAITFLKIDEAKYTKLYQHKHGAGLIYEQLFKLREHAFFAPTDVAEELKKMERYWWSNSGGEIEEVFNSIQHDVSVISANQWVTH